jgi:hypothetical protein
MPAPISCFNIGLSPSECEKVVWGEISYAFSHPVQRSETSAHYAPTQVLVEAFMKAGYEGIAYRSLLGEGLNIAMFDLAIAEVIDGTLYEIKGVKYQMDQADNTYYIPKHPPTNREANRHIRFITRSESTVFIGNRGLPASRSRGKVTKQFVSFPPSESHPENSACWGGRFWAVRRKSWLCNQFDETFDDLLEVSIREFADTTTDPLDRDRANLRYLDPRCARETLRRQFRSQRKSSGLGLAGDSHCDYGSRPAVEQIVTEDEDWPESRLFPPSRRVEIRPINLAPQYCGQDSSPRPSSAKRCSSPRSSPASSLARRPRFSRSTSKSTADWSARLRFG